MVQNAGLLLKTDKTKDVERLEIVAIYLLFNPNFR